MEAAFQAVIEELAVLSDDATVPKSVKAKLTEIQGALRQTGDQSLKAHKALQLIEDITDDINVPAYTRTQIWNIASMLEKVSVS